jgi:hypothetical protein
MPSVPDREAGGDFSRRLQDLVASPREDLAIELKPWLSLNASEEAAAIGQALLALANHGGGFLLIGFAESEGSWRPAPDRPSTLSAYNQDAINGIVARYAEPTFHCEVHHVAAPETGELFPVVVVPGGHRVPIRAKADSPERRHIKINTYYIRRPGPSSDAPRTGGEWDELISRCVRASRDGLVESIRAVLETPSSLFASGELQTPTRNRLDDWVEESRARFETRLDTEFQNQMPRARYEHGIYTAAYSVEGDFAPPDLGAFRDLLREIQGHETGWPPWQVTSGEFAPVPFDGTIECWIFSTTFADPAHSDFWRASPSGLMYQIEGYDDDSYPGQFPPGERFDFSLPIWRIGPCLLHAERLATALGDPGAEVSLRFIWEGLAGRELSSWAQPGRYMPPERRPAVQDSVESRVSARADRISDNLPELIREATAPLYAIFDFFAIPPETLRTQVAEMRGAA